MNLRDKSILISGGAGFIGSELARQIIPISGRIIIVDNLVNGLQKNVEDLLDDKVDLHVEDIRDDERMESLMREVDIVFHLACLGVRHSIHSPMENYDVNATATLKLLDTARRNEISRFVYISSSEVYGTAKWAPMTETHPTFPMTVYGAGKLAAECSARAYFHTYNYPTVIVRPFNCFGPRCHHEGDSGEVIPKFMLRTMLGKPMIVFGDGTQTRDFTYVADTARGILLAGISDQAVGQTINIGMGTEISINELAEQIARIMDAGPAEIIHEAHRPGDVLRLLADTTLARELLGFVPEVSLADGLARLNQWYQDSGDNPEDLLQDEVVSNWELAG